MVEGNYYDKYRSRNPIVRYLMSGFLASADELLETAQPQSLIEVGCGPGDLADHLVNSTKSSRTTAYLGLDIGVSTVGQARRHHDWARFSVADASWLPVRDKSFDCAVACEVLEHLTDPAVAVRELWRVARRFVLVSVPWEPIWRLSNLARGAYLTRLGNTPGHLQHFSRPAARALLRPRFEIVEERHPFPWTMLLARPLAGSQEGQ